MPFKSNAQRRKFGELVKQGKMSQKTFDEWNSDTPKELPDRIHPKPQEQTLGQRLRKVAALKKSKTF